MNRLLVVAGLFLVAVPVLRADDPGSHAPAAPRRPGDVQAPIGLPLKVEDIKIEQRLGAQVPPELTFRDETGKTVRLGDYFGDRPLILVLAYYRCPMLCTQVLNHLAERLRSKDMPLTAGRDFTILTVSFDAREQPELAAAKKAVYVEEYGRPGAEAAWHFLTGEQGSIGALAEAVGFHFRYDAERDQFTHASGIMLLTPQGQVSRYFFGLTYYPRDLHLGLVEASDNKIGSPVVNSLMLFCFQYDGEKGRYVASMLNLVRGGGVLTVLAIIGYIVWARRREKRQLHPFSREPLANTAAPHSPEARG
jgi:protein SCO1/2